MDEALNQRLAAQAQAPRWWVALSGGVDSIVLLEILHRWLQRNDGPSLAAIHVHHGLQSDADDWAEHCQQQCDRRDIPLHIHRVAVTNAASQGVEAAARAARYGIFEMLLKDNEVLFQGHHLDDQAETMLLRLLRGAGPQGLAGIPEQRPLGAGFISRPLLDFPKQQLEAWAHTRELSWVTDPSNSDTGFDRNFLRGQVMPLLAQRWPGYRQTFARAAALQAESAKLLQQPILPACESIFGDPGMRLSTVAGEPATAVQLNQALHAWLTRLGISVPSRTRLQEFSRQLLTARSDRHPEVIMDTVVFKRWRGAVYRLPAGYQTPQDGQQHTALCTPQQAVPVGELTVAEDIAGDWGEMYWRSSGGSCLQAGTKVTLRPAIAGERFATQNAKHKSFKQLCQERGIPPWWREHPLIVCHKALPVAILGVGLLTDGTHDPVNMTDLGYEPRYIPFVGSNAIE